MSLVTPDLGLLFWMLLSFLVVLFLLKKFAWKPILNSLHEREDEIETALNAAEKARTEMQNLKDNNERILQEAREERERIVRESQDLRERILNDAREQARQERDKILEEARMTIASEKAAAVQEIRAMSADLSVAIAEKLLRKELSSATKQKEYLQELTANIPLN